MWVVKHYPRYGEGWEICDDFLFKSTEGAIEWIKHMANIYFYENLKFNHVDDNLIIVQAGDKWMCDRFRIEKWRIYHGTND